MSDPATNPFDVHAQLQQHREALGQVQAHFQMDQQQVAQRVDAVVKYGREMHGHQHFDDRSAAAIENLGGDNARPAFQRTISKMSKEDAAEYVLHVAEMPGEEARRLGAMDPETLAHELGRIQGRINPNKADGIVGTSDPHADNPAKMNDRAFEAWFKEKYGWDSKLGLTKPFGR